MSKKDKLLSLSFLFFLACLNVTLKTPDTPNCRSALRNHSQSRSVRPQLADRWLLLVPPKSALRQRRGCDNETALHQNLAPISPKNAKGRWGVQETPPETAFRPPSV